MNLWATVGKVPKEILHVFDPMLDELVTEVHGSDVSYTVKFKTEISPISCIIPIALEISFLPVPSKARIYFP